MEPDRVWPPTPDNLVGVPVWENVVAQQVVQASLGNLPEHTLAFGVVVDAMRVTLHFQLTEVTEADVVDMGDIEDALHMQTGHILEVSRNVRCGSSGRSPAGAAPSGGSSCRGPRTRTNPPERPGVLLKPATSTHRQPLLT